MNASDLTRVAAKKKASSEPHPPPTKEIPHAEIARKIASTVAWAGVFEKWVDRIGAPTSFLVIIVFAVWKLGSPKTQDDFIREVLFADVTHTRWVSVFMGTLIALGIANLVAFRRRKIGEGKELKRVSDEKSALQEGQLGSKLHHTDGEAKNEPVSSMRVDS